MKRLLLRLLLYGTALFAALPVALSGMLIAPPPRQATDPPPRDARVETIVSGGLELRAWLFEGDPAKPAFVFTHGVGDSLESFEGSGRRANALGHPALLLDLRGHGGSEGKYMTLGGFERDDVRAAMRFLSDTGRAKAGFVLSGVSMGAVAVLRAAAGRDDVRAVIAEAPFDSMRGTAAHHAKLYFHLPGFLPIVPLTVAVAEWRAGFDADDVDAVAAAREVRAPLLAIADGADPRMPPEVVRRVAQAHGGVTRLWLVPGADHAGASLHPDYWPTVLAFLAENGVSATPAAPRP